MHGAECLDTLASINTSNLALTWNGQDQCSKAINFMKEYMRLLQRILGIDLPHSIPSSKALAR
jgi:hypothetical protein